MEMLKQGKIDIRVSCVNISDSREASYFETEDRVNLNLDNKATTSRSVSSEGSETCTNCTCVDMVIQTEEKSIILPLDLERQRGKVASRNL